MIFDNLTIAVMIWGVITAVAVVLLANCDLCPIKKLLSKPCEK